MSECRSCETEFAEGSNFCPHCGFRTEKGETENVKTPVDRRPEWEQDVELALQNAQKLMEEAFEAAKKGLQQVKIELEREVGKVKEIQIRKGPVFCPKCGAKNPSDSEYCTTCGKHVRGSS
ncbi:MAG: zinc-ribbon domain-containing protein [Candidatus Bathyarchaeota archaeon]